MSPSYTIAPHLSYFNIPLADFAAARPEFESFGVGGYIFSEDADAKADGPSEPASPSPPRILLIQRALTDSMPGCWEGPGGASEPGEDSTLLDGVAREVLEETGLHVSRVVELVSVDCWTHTRRNGEKLRIAKYSFIVEVYEAVRQTPEGLQLSVPRKDIPVQLVESEHRVFDWTTEEDVRDSLNSSEVDSQSPLPLTPRQAPNILRAFEQLREHRKRTI